MNIFTKKQNQFKKVFIWFIVFVFLFSSPAAVLADEGDLGGTTSVEEPPIEVWDEDNLVGVEPASGEDPAKEGQAEEKNIDIETGDAGAVVDILNEVNTNTTEVDNSTSTDDIFDDEEDGSEAPATTTEAFASLPPEDDATGTPDIVPSVDLEVENYNEATTTNDVVVETNTGDNGIENEDEDADSSIETGDVFSVVNLLNIINTNLAGVNWENIFFTAFSSVYGDINLADAFSGDNPSTTGDIDVTNNNSADVDNNVDITANSGDNQIITSSGDVIIDTGDVKVVVNIINIVNTNVTGSNWLIANINIFGDFIGDLVLPSEEDMASLLQGGNYSGDIEVENNNDANVQNEIEVNANSGDNTIVVDDGNGYIDTGDVTVVTNVENIVNTNVTGSNWLFANVNVLNNWQGTIYGLPSYADVTNTAGGVSIFGSNWEIVTTGPSIDGDLSVTNNNDADVTNNITIDANSGGNSTEGGDSSLITTGSVDVLTNLLNVVNSNFTGSSFVLANVNIMGNWQGDLAFGQPDLELKLTVTPELSSESSYTIGDHVTYTYEWVNNGSTKATNVILYDNYDNIDSRVINAGGGNNDFQSGVISWELGDIPAGGSGSVSYTVEVPEQGALINGDRKITNLALILGDEADANMADNSVSKSLPIYFKTSGTTPNDNHHDYSDGYEYFSINKTNDVEGEYITGTTTVTYTITLENISSGYIYDVYLFDILRDPAGNVIYNQNWPLGTMEAGETVTIEYAVDYAADAEPGRYINIAAADGFLGGTNDLVGVDIENSIIVEGEVNASGSGGSNPAPGRNTEEGSAGDNIVTVPAAEDTTVEPEITAPSASEPIAYEPKIPEFSFAKEALAEKIEDLEEKTQGIVLGETDEKNSLDYDKCPGNIPWWLIIIIILFYVIVLSSYYYYWSKKEFKHRIYFPIVFTLIIILVILALLKCLI